MIVLPKPDLQRRIICILETQPYNTKSSNLKNHSFRRINYFELNKTQKENQFLISIFYAISVVMIYCVLIMLSGGA
jgi:hypothetical protein